MNVEATDLPGVLVVEPRVFEDARGWFAETWVAARYADAGIAGPFVQDNVSKSRRGALRGLHLQNPHAQGKLVCALAGEIFDVAVDVRRGSPTFGRWVGVTLSEKNHRQLWIPAGFAHGFCVTSDDAIFHYKCTQAYRPESEMSVAWDDPDLAIAWPVADPILTDKDRRAPRLRDIAPERLPEYP